MFRSVQTPPRIRPAPIPANCNYSPGLGACFDRFFVWCGLGLGVPDLTGARADAAGRLDRLPDGALGAMGLAREDIPRFVFRDLFSFRGPR